MVYHDGIDVEVNRERGISLIASAGEAELPEAMEMLYTMYEEGNDTAKDYRKAYLLGKENCCFFIVKNMVGNILLLLCI